MNRPQPPSDFLSSYTIGLKLRTLRAEKRLTLARLGAEIGMSTALLSKLETDRMFPTLPTLARLCQVYGVGLSYFFSDPTHHTLAITRKAHMAEPPRVQPTLKRTLLHAVSAQSKLICHLLDVPTGVTSTIGVIGTPTELSAYVLSGTLRLTIGGADEVLNAGDCIVLDTDALVLCSTDDSPCRVLAVSSKS